MRYLETDKAIVHITRPHLSVPVLSPLNTVSSLMCDFDRYTALILSIVQPVSRCIAWESYQWERNSLAANTKDAVSLITAEYLVNVISYVEVRNSRR